MPTMLWKTTSGAALTIGLLGALSVSGNLGCGASSAATPPSTTAPSSALAQTGDDDASAQVLEHHRHHHGGVTMFIVMSLDTLGVTPDQRANIQKIDKDLLAKLEPGRAAEQSVLTLLADGIAAGSVDKAKVDIALTQADGAFVGVHAATADALNQLHAVLDPTERAALAEKVQAHWEVWQHANDDDDSSAQREHGRYFSTLEHQMGLSSDQVGKVRSALKANAPESAKRLDANEIETHLRAFEAAFASDAFDARTLNGAESANVHVAGAGMRRMARFYEALAPVLTEDQRAKLAARIREHANRQEVTAS